VGDQSIAQISDLMQALTHDRIVGEALVQTKLGVRKMFVIHDHCKYTNLPRSQY